MNFCEKMVFLNISESCLKINRTSTYVRGHHVSCEKLNGFLTCI